MNVFKIIEFVKKIALKVNSIREDILRPFVIYIWPRWITPNMISLFRIVLALTLITMLFEYEKWHSWIVFLFILGLFTDLLDGTMARTLNMSTKIGAILDPVADKLLSLPLFFYLIRDMKFLLFAIIGLEAFTIFIAIVGIKMRLKVKANIWGKFTFVFHATGLLLLLLFSNKLWASRALWIAVGLALASIVGHLRYFFTRPSIKIKSAA